MPVTLLWTTPVIENEVLLALAPTHLPALRASRFDGLGLEVPLSRFAPEDAAVLRRVYREAEGLSQFWRSMATAPDWQALGRAAATLAAGGLVEDCRRLGRATAEAGLATPEMHRAIHDARGGGLTVLLGVAELLSLLGPDEVLTRTCAAAARDHAKIMRCLLPDIDPPARAADEADKPHSINHFVDKWREARLRGPSGPVEVSLRCAFRGDISARCLETAALDRVVYNLVNNAARFAAVGRIDLAVAEVSPGLTRWAVGNEVSAEEAAFLRRADLRRLFAGGMTRGGTGVGLSNCAEVVADCFGLTCPADSASRGYVGAALRGKVFLAWFHWPASAPRRGPAW